MKLPVDPSRHGREADNVPVRPESTAASSTPATEDRAIDDPAIGAGADSTRRVAGWFSLAGVHSRVKAALSTSAPSKPASIQRRAVGGAFWSISGYGVQQGLRMGSHLVLARLLLPEAFGLMALSTIILIGLEMLSDVGLGPAIVQGRHGDDPKLLHSAWTIQIIRGFFLYCIALLLALPLASWYEAPQLRLLVPALGLTTVLRGFTSIRLHSLHRAIRIRPIAILEITVQAITSVIMIVAALLWPTVWALVIGRLVGDVFRTVLSHVALPGARDRLGWDRQAVKDLITVGRWIFLSTAINFAAGNLDRLSLGHLFTMTELGIYSVAFMFCDLLLRAGITVGSKVFFPVLAETVREDVGILYTRLRKIRLLWLVPAAFALVALSIGGDWLVNLLYKAEFHEAGWMLRILAAGTVVAVINKSGAVVWLALGEFRVITFLLLVQIPVLCGAMFAGYHLAGIVGVVTGVALTEALVYPLHAILLWRRKLWQPEVDLPVAAVSGLLVALGYWMG